MSHFRSIFRQISSNNSYQVSSYGPRNNAFYTFSPSDIAGLTTWIDPSDVTAVTASANFIDAITNKGSVACTFRANGSTARPYLSASYVNGRDVISFDGVNDILTSSVGNISLFGGVSPATTYTACVALKYNRVNTFGPYPYGLDVVASMASNSWMITMGSTTAATSRTWHDFGSSTESDWVKTSVGQIVSGNVASVIVTFATKTYDLYHNGTYVSSVVRTFSPTVNAGSLRIGNEIFPASGNPAKFELCEFLIYTGSLTPAEISTVHSYFANKWAIT